MGLWILRWWDSRRLAERAWEAGYAAGLVWRYADDPPAPPPLFHGGALAQWHRGFRLGHQVSLDGSSVTIHRRAREFRSLRRSS